MSKIMQSIVKRNAAAGHHFFERDTMSFFNSRVEGFVGGSRKLGAYFVTSEQFEEGYPRLYTVRVQSSDGRISTVGDFQQYSTLEAAKVAAWDLVDHISEENQ